MTDNLKPAVLQNVFMEYSNKLGYIKNSLRLLRRTIIKHTIFVVYRCLIEKHFF